MAGNIGVMQLASMSIMVSLGTMLNLIAIGFQETTAAIIGNCIGAQNVPLAKRFFWLICKLAAATIIGLALMVVFLREPITTLYTSDPEVKALTLKILPLVGFNYLFDGAQ